MVGGLEEVTEACPRIALSSSSPPGPPSLVSSTQHLSKFSSSSPSRNQCSGGGRAAAAGGQTPASTVRFTCRRCATKYTGSRIRMVHTNSKGIEKGKVWRAWSPSPAHCSDRSPLYQLTHPTSAYPTKAAYPSACLQLTAKAKPWRQLEHMRCPRGDAGCQGWLAPRLLPLQPTRSCVCCRLA